MDIPKVHIPKVHIPKVHIPKVHIPKVHIPKVHIPKVHIFFVSYATASNKILVKQVIGRIFGCLAVLFCVVHWFLNASCGGNFSNLFPTSWGIIIT